MEIPSVRTLADFKRFLADPRARLKMVRHDFLDKKKAAGGKLSMKQEFMYTPRKIGKLQSKSAMFEPAPGEKDGSWFDIDKASEWRFEEPNVAILMLTDDNTVEYELSYE